MAVIAVFVTAQTLPPARAARDAPIVLAIAAFGILIMRTPRRLPD
jgi:hypothetical protein